MSADLALAALMADPQVQQQAPVGAPTSVKKLNAQFAQDQGADDEGNAQCLHSMFGDEFLYCDAYGYLNWLGNYWRAEGAEAALRRAAVYTLKQRHILATRGSLKHIMSCSVPSAKRVRDMLYLFQAFVTAGVSAFDASPDEINCANGVLNLATGQLTPHDPAQRFTYCIPVEYDPKADQTLWRQFLADVVGGGPEVIDYLQLAVGYSLTGYTREECLFYLHGPTRSGKGTFTETLLAMLPKPIGMEVEFTTFTADRGADTQNFDLAPLKPARILFASESNKYQALNPGKIKALTGGNEVYCAFKRRDHFSYRPQYKMWLVSNHPVNADVDDDALWGRVNVIEFPNSFIGKEDTSLKLRMQQPEALRGVLAWAVEGAIKWYALGPKGLRPQTPAVVRDTTKRHRAEMDYVQAWLDECCEISPASWTANERIYQSYHDWCIGNGVEMKKVRSFILSLKGKGFIVGDVRKVNNAAKRGVVGLNLLP